MTLLWTAQYRYFGPDRIDITMKCPKDSIGTAFRPGWELVMGVRNGTLTENQYTGLYIERMRVSYSTNRAYWDALLQKSYVTLVCFCPAGDFCHRLILGRDILGNHFQNVTYKGERLPDGKTW